MRKYLLGIAAVILAVTFSSFSVNQKTNTPDPLFHWFFLNGQYTGNEDTKSGEADATDCTGDNELCEYGYDDPEDFIDGDPVNGLAPGAVPDSEIREVD